MIVILPNVENETVYVIPRYTPVGAMTLSLFNKQTQEITTPSIQTGISGGVLSVRISETFTEGDTFRFTVLEGSKIVYTDTLFVTAQTVQNYDITSDTYTYSTI